MGLAILFRLLFSPFLQIIFQGLMFIISQCFFIKVCWSSFKKSIIIIIIFGWCPIITYNYLKMLTETSLRTYDSAKYINQYYKTVQGYNQEGQVSYFFTWMKEAFELVPPCDFGIEIGCGPVLNLAAFSSRKIKNLILTEFNTDCFKFIQSWAKAEENEFTPDWTEHFKVIANLESTKQDVAERVRNSIFLCQKIDLTNPQIFTHPFLRKVDIITSSLCIEAVATSNNQYKEMIRRLKNYLKPQGYLFLIGVLQESFYLVEDQKLPCFEVTEELLKETMNDLGFKIIKINVFRPQNPSTDHSDYKGIFSLLAQLI